MTKEEVRLFDGARELGERPRLGASETIKWSIQPDVVITCVDGARLEFFGSTHEGQLDNGYIGSYRHRVAVGASGSLQVIYEASHSFAGDQHKDIDPRTDELLRLTRREEYTVVRTVAGHAWWEFLGPHREWLVEEFSRVYFADFPDDPRTVPGR